ncbi:unnamed protein product [Kluyveromyces dobzhanskii CBS 2104]|uniref:Peroxisome assembly protein 12 n=1 Tax=Kluyveromyces dobzhanskii CBS 2104 TaxID=1427455 RepID=A0A0A8L8E7_9SACH|nr:unnamed protein product [Kluyveromyces dobzhanskii CBS 2104]
MDFYSNLPVNLQQPTLFEILSVNEVKKLIKPTLRYILSIYIQYRGPTRWLLKIFSRFDFIILVVKSLIEYRHYKTTGATILDKFYGLKRFSRFPNLTFLGIWLNDCLFEYMSDVCDQYHEILQGRKLSSPELNIWQQWFDVYYPKFKKSVKIINFCFKLKYLRDSKDSDVVHFLTQVRYERYQEPEEEVGSRKKIISVSDRRRKRTNVPRILAMTKDAVENTSTLVLDKLFPSFLVMIRILQVINQRPELFKQETRIKKPKPPVLPSADGDTAIEETNDICPLCGEKISEPAMISSGYIANLECAKKMGKYRKHMFRDWHSYK